MTDQEVDNEDDNREWKICCSNSSKPFVKYLSQVGFGAAVVIFSMIQISRNVDDKAIYFGIMSATVGIFMPHPTMSKEAK